jgi:dihydroorotase-like cyclic amidohydrolase
MYMCVIGRITLEDVIAKMYTNPKRIFNLPDQEVCNI